MKSKRKALPRRIAAGLGAIALGMMGALGGGMAANAVGDSPNLDGEYGSIIVHKYAEPDTATGLPNDGTAQDMTGYTALDGVTFTVQQVTSIDLTTYEGWDAAEGLTAADILADPAAHPLGAAITGVTGDPAVPEPAGTATFGNLPVGLYLVTETDAGDNPIAVKAEPFLVSVPLPTGDNTWLYDVHVYPKNAVTTIDKVVDDSDAYGLGDIVTWTVTAEVPHLADGDVFNRFDIADTLDSRLGYSSASVSLEDAAGAAVPLTSGTDFTLVAPADGASGLVSVVFTPTGLAKLDAAQGGMVSVDIDTSVLAIGDGTIENEAVVFINEFEGNADAATDWGALKIHKITKDGHKKSYLSGAEFQIFASEADAASLTNPVSVDGGTTFTSGPDGKILVGGLKAGSYWVVETKAPVGYTGHDGAIPVTIAAGSTAEALLLEVLNQQKPSVDLPLTGANGVLLLTLGGAGLLSLAGGTALVNHRRRSGRA